MTIDFEKNKLIVLKKLIDLSIQNPSHSIDFTILEFEGNRIKASLIDKNKESISLSFY